MLPTPLVRYASSLAVILTNVVSLGRDNAETMLMVISLLIWRFPTAPVMMCNIFAPRCAEMLALLILHKTANDTWDKIVETVFLALLATVFGTFLAIPLSFIAARNLMKPVKSPLDQHFAFHFGLADWDCDWAFGRSRIGRF